MTKRLKKRMEEFLKETVEFYSINNRAYSKYYDSCVYETDEGARCAIGRKLDDKYLKRVKSCGFNVNTCVDDVFESLGRPEFFKDMPTDFLMVVQRLHDDKGSWDEDGINECGILKVVSITSAYELSPIEINNTRKIAK